MRTKNLEICIDRLFWALLLVMPVIAFFIMNDRNTVTFIQVLEQFNVNESNIIYSGLAQLFGNGGTLEFLDTTSTSSILLYLSYMAILELCHLFFDTIFFIPRICINLIDRATEMGNGVKKW